MTNREVAESKLGRALAAVGEASAPIGTPADALRAEVASHLAECIYWLKRDEREHDAAEKAR